MQAAAVLLLLWLASRVPGCATVQSRDVGAAIWVLTSRTELATFECFSHRMSRPDDMAA